MRPPATIMLLIGLILFATSCQTDANSKLQFTSPFTDSITKPRQISLKDLRKNYKALQGQQVEIKGNVWFEFENVSICSNREGLNDEEKKCFWLDFKQDLNLNDSLMQMASGQTFTIRGTVDTSITGHFGMYLGTIKDIYFMHQE